MWADVLSVKGIPERAMGKEGPARDSRTHEIIPMDEMTGKKMFKQFVILNLVLVLFLSAESSWAERAYVTDSFTITLRTGPSTENKILSMLPSGRAVQVIENQGDWSRVETTEGGETKSGWVLSRYLMTRVPFEQRAETLAKEVDRLQEKLTPSESAMREKTTQVRELTEKLNETTTALQNVQRDYQTLKDEASEFLALREAHAKALSELESTRQELESLTKTYRSVRSSERNKWFMLGAGVLLLGLIIGLIFGRRDKKRRSSYY